MDVEAASERSADVGLRKRISARDWRPLLRSAGVIAFSGAITAVVVMWHGQVRALGRYGYLGVFLISLLGNATVILPAPSLAAVVAIGAVLNPLWVGLAAGVGEALGELTGFLAGYGGRAIVQDHVAFQRVERWVRRYGVLVIFVLSAVPNPLFDLAGIAAGVMRLPLWQFLLSCWVGKTIKTTAFAMAGAHSVGFLIRLLS